MQQRSIATWQGKYLECNTAIYTYNLALQNISNATFNLYKLANKKVENAILQSMYLQFSNQYIGNFLECDIAIYCTYNLAATLQFCIYETVWNATIYTVQYILYIYVYLVRAVNVTTAGLH